MPDEWHPELTTGSHIKPAFPKIYLGPPKGAQNSVPTFPPEIIPDRMVQLIVLQDPENPRGNLFVHELGTLALIREFDVIAFIDGREFECPCTCRKCRHVPRKIRKRIVKVNTYVVETSSDDNHAGGKSPRSLEEMIHETLERIEHKVQRNRNDSGIRIENKDSLVFS